MANAKTSSIQLVVSASANPTDCLSLFAYACVCEYLCVCVHKRMCCCVQAAAHQVRKPRWDEGSYSWLKMTDGGPKSPVCVCVCVVCPQCAYTHVWTHATHTPICWFCTCSHTELGKAWLSFPERVDKFQISYPPNTHTGLSVDWKEKCGPFAGAAFLFCAIKL